jgi:hypothetical protein
MRRRRWIMIAALGGILLVVAVGWAQREPVYQGRSLRVWLRGFDGETAEARWRSAEAVRQMGPGVVPWLISRLSHARPGPEPKWKQWIRELLSRQSVVTVAPFRRTDERCEALAALDALWPGAKAAVPALEGLLHQSPPDHRALLVLARIGPEAVPVLNRALTNDTRVIRMGARACLDGIRSHSNLVFPKTPEDADFMRRSCEFNLKMVQGAFLEYRSQHPEQFLPDSIDSRPPPSLPPDFVPPATTRTNRRAAALPEPRPGYE